MASRPHRHSPRPSGPGAGGVQGRPSPGRWPAPFDLGRAGRRERREVWPRAGGGRGSSSKAAGVEIKRGPRRWVAGPTPGGWHLRLNDPGGPEAAALGPPPLPFLGGRRRAPHRGRARAEVPGAGLEADLADFWPLWPLFCGRKVDGSCVLSLLGVREP